MGAVIRGELYKMLRLRKTMMAVFGMSVASLGLFCFTLYVWLKRPELFGRVAAVAATNASEARSLLLGFHLTLTSIFSLMTLFFMSLVIGELMGKESSQGTAKCLFLAPVWRWQVFFGKFIAVAALYGMAFLVDMLIRGLTLGVLVWNERILAGVIRWSDVWKISAIYIVLDLSHLAYVFLVSILARSIEMTMVYSVIFYVAMMIGDFILFALRKLEMLGATMANLSAYTYTATCGAIDYDALRDWVQGARGQFPISTDMLGVNVLYTTAFLALGCWLYSRKEDRSEL